MIEIKIWGRGGQGAVTTGQIIAIAALHEKKFCQTFPNFGVERRGAPVEAFVRIDKDPIRLRSQVYNPDLVIVLDPTLIGAVDVTKGLKDGGIVLINTSKKKEELEIGKKFKIYAIDATSVAMNIFKRPIVNTPLLGAFSGITKIVSLESLQKAIDERFDNAQMASLNKDAVKKIYEESCG